MPTVVELDRADSRGCWFLPKIIELKTFCLDFDNVQKSKILGSFLFFQIIEAALYFHMYEPHV